MLEKMGMEAFAERASRELQATGETARKRTAAPGGPQLTAQEAQIARMAREGLSNPEIAARLFISSTQFTTTCAKSSPNTASARAASSTASYPNDPPPTPSGHWDLDKR